MSNQNRGVPWLSIFVCGLGQLTQERIGMGLAMLGGAFIVGVFTLGLGAVPFWIWSIVDAFNYAKQVDSGG